MSDKPQEGTGRRRILIVDDDALMQRFYKSMFRKHEDEFECTVKGSAEAALDHLNRNPVDAVILDWDLPVVKGLDVLKALRAHPRTKALPVIMATGRSAEADKALAEKLGASAFFTKPFDVAELLERLRALLHPGNQ
jgi:DNA-binding response OmpR family regulator